MTENGTEQNLQEVINHNRFNHEHKFHLKRIHHTLGFWIGVILIFVAITYYIVSVDFAFAPAKQSKQSERTTTPQLFDGMILKTNMEVPGLSYPKQESVDEVADGTETGMTTNLENRQSRQSVDP